MGKHKKDIYGNPIVSCWISQDGSFAFVEFRTIEECKDGFCVGQLSLYGRPLKVGRTKHSLNQDELVSARAKGQSLGDDYMMGENEVFVPRWNYVIKF